MMKRGGFVLFELAITVAIAALLVVAWALVLLYVLRGLSERGRSLSNLVAAIRATEQLLADVRCAENSVRDWQVSEAGARWRCVSGDWVAWQVSGRICSRTFHGMKDRVLDGVHRCTFRPLIVGAVVVGVSIELELFSGVWRIIQSLDKQPIIEKGKVVCGP